ncbi:MAG TPA: enoyl-CoA hydratase-related protein [Dehalococcoidia bacterium]|nr:enoyl-CoA hydratase-related protein [Dehalococcoidia bacterium]
MSEPDVIRELTDDGVLVLTLNRPDTLNSLGGTMIPDLIAAAGETKTNDRIRAIVLTGKGRGFCSGATIVGDSTTTIQGDAPLSRRSSTVNKLGVITDLVLALFESDVPVIGAINGFAVGGGFGLALCCDVRIASDQARMGPIFIKRGLSLDCGASFWLPRIVGVAKAYELAYSGEPLPADELLRLGLVNKVVPHESLMDEAMALARAIASGPAIAYTYTRRLIARSLDNDIRAQLELEAGFQTDALASPDGREGFRAFAERRSPQFLR